MKHTGWRKPTPGLGVAEKHAQAGEQLSISKTRAFVAAKRVGAHIGLKAGDMLLLDTLGAFTQAQDWEAGQRPIVWASNCYLMAQTGFSLSALKRHARRLAEAGVIAFKDSSNGKRWGRRNAEGFIIEAYGFDLSPLAARAEEFERLQATLEAERSHCSYLKRQITIARRMIRARLEAALTEALCGPWETLQVTFEALLARLPRRAASSGILDELLEGLLRLQARVEDAYMSFVQQSAFRGKPALTQGKLLYPDEIMDPKESISEPHILTTKKLDSVTSNCSEKEVAERVAPRKTDDDPEPTKVTIDVQTVMQACPEFAKWVHDVGEYLNTWSDIHRMASQFRPMIGISENAWNEAQLGLGKQVASAAFVLVFDKHATGEVASPGGYLRGMVEKAGAGALQLERSIYGRLRRHAA